MKKTRLIVENKVYLISNESVHANAMFKEQSDRIKFIKLLKEYLEPICDILAVRICDFSFHLVLRIKSRDTFIDFYKMKHKKGKFEAFFIPICSHIFGRQMSNMLVSYVKSYNWKYKRKGCLIGGRYKRQLIESQEELQRICSEFNQRPFVKNKTMDKPRKRKKKRMIDDIIQMIQENIELIRFSGNELRGCFDKNPKIDLIEPFLREKMKIFRKTFPCGPNYC